jgi:aspartate racemase
MNADRIQSAKVIGVLGGISPFSTTYYYELLNAGVRARLGGRHSARCLIHAVDFAHVEAMHGARDWSGVVELLSAGARSLEAGGADCFLIACNTMHNVAAKVASAVAIPFLHIGDAVAETVNAAGIKRVGLLGTRFTMEAPFLRERIEARGVEVRVPDAPARRDLHRIIYDELCAGVMRDESRGRFLRAVRQLEASEGIEGVVLGCTEIGLLVNPDDLPVPGFDTARSHAQAAVAFSLAGL